MKNEDKVIIPEQAQEFVELGIVVECEKYWLINAEGNSTLVTRSTSMFNPDLQHLPETKWLAYPAPDVAELGELLGRYQVCRMMNRTWELDYVRHGIFLEKFDARLPEAQARGAAVIWLKKNGYLKDQND